MELNKKHIEKGNADLDTGASDITVNQDGLNEISKFMGFKVSEFAGYCQLPFYDTAEYHFNLKTDKDLIFNSNGGGDTHSYECELSDEENVVAEKWGQVVDEVIAVANSMKDIITDKTSFIVYQKYEVTVSNEPIIIVINCDDAVDDYFDYEYKLLKESNYNDYFNTYDLVEFEASDIYDFDDDELQKQIINCQKTTFSQ